MEVEADPLHMADIFGVYFIYEEEGEGEREIFAYTWEFYRMVNLFMKKMES